MKAALVGTIACGALLAGCAGSANHEVVSVHQSHDESLSCGQLDVEIVSAQLVLDGVDADRRDINGADVVDTILWFPFNLIAKSQNYQNATEAASKRIGRLQDLRKTRGCKVDSARQLVLLRVRQDLEALQKRYKDGDFDGDAYLAARRKLLEDAAGR